MQKESTNPKDRLGKLKPSLTAFPPAAKIHASLAMMDGAKKYGPFNWRDKTVSARVYLDAADRHLTAYLDGEDFAPDSGIHHLGHAIASIAIILDALENGTLVDDRPTKGAAARLLERYTKQAEKTVIVADPTQPENGLDDLALRFNTGDDGSLIPMIDPRINVVGIITDPKDAVYDLTVEKKRRVYVAGPMRGYEKFNFPAFDRARDLAISLGFDPISPADLDRASGFHEDSPPISATTPDITREFVERDCRALLSLRSENDDAIALLPGWEKSTGAVAEFFVARWLGLKVLNALTFQPFEPGQIRAADLEPMMVNVLKTLGVYVE